MKLSQSLLVVLAVSTIGAQAQLQAPAQGALHDCFLKGIRVEHTETKPFAFHGDVESRYYGTCNNGTLTCHRDSAIADSMSPTVDCAELASNHRRLRVALPEKDRVKMGWPKEVLCYRPLNVLTSRQKAMFLRAAEEYGNKTTIKIISLAECKARDDAGEICGGCQHAIQVSKERDECSSFIGYHKMENQVMMLADKCFAEHRKILHELGHALGLFHEHSHRQRQIIILRDGTTVDKENYIRNMRAANSKYDPDSVMHYTLGRSMCMPKNEYANTRFCDADEDLGKDGCILPEEKHCDRDHPLEKRAGFSTKLSAGDIASINYIYPPPPPEKQVDTAKLIGLHNFGVATHPGVIDGTLQVYTQEQGN